MLFPADRLVEHPEK
jgi:hypothetical protein